MKRTKATQRNTAEEALLESEAWLALAAEAGAVGVYDWDIVKDSAKCSDQFYRIYGTEPHPSFSLQDTMERVHEDDREWLLEALDHTLEHDASLVEEYRVVWPDGSIHWIRELAQVTRNDEGRAVRLLGALTDITEKKRAEEALRGAVDELKQQVASYRSVFEAGSEGCIIHEDGVILEINPQFEALAGYRCSELVGKSFLDLVAEESKTLVMDRMRGPHGRPFDMVGLKKDGSRIHLEVVGKDHLREGRSVRLVSVRDISERKQAEEALREGEERYRDYYEQAPDAYLSVNPLDGLVIECNRTAADMLGRAQDEIIGHKIFDFYTPESFERVQATLRQLQAQGAVHGIELRLQREDGKRMDVSLHATAVRDDTGRVVRSRSAWRDITERKQAEEALQRLREELDVKVEAEMLRGNAYGLTFRELTVLHLVAAGRADKEIAGELGIRPHTASRHVKNIMKKMSATSRTDAGVRAVREELID